MDRIILVGADDVLAGGRIMRDAAGDMIRAASEISNAAREVTQAMQAAKDSMDYLASELRRYNDAKGGE